MKRPRAHSDCSGCSSCGTNIQYPKRPIKVCGISVGGTGYIKDCPCMTCLVKVLCTDNRDNCYIFQKYNYYHWKPIIDECRPDHKSEQELKWDKEYEDEQKRC